MTKTELVWPSKYNEDGTRQEVSRMSLPFQVIETVNESRAPSRRRTPTWASRSAGKRTGSWCALHEPVEETKGRAEKTQAEARVLADKARALVGEAKDAYRSALAPYREAYHKAGIECEKQSINKAAYTFVERRTGPREKVENKGGSGAL